MPDAADDLTDAGIEQYELHINGLCQENECQFCQQEEIWG